MRTKRALLLAAALAGGCASTQQYPETVSAGTELRLAAQMIESGRPEQAEMWLDRARMQYRGEAPEYVTLLTAESKLRQGLPVEALALAGEVLDLDPAHPGANEVAGKILLKLDRYRDAEQRFLSAQLAYTPDTPAFRRLDDMIAFARGLDAYANADPDVANKHWEGISDPQLRFALDKARRELTVR